MSRQLKELRALMPFSWDPRIEQHPAGKSSLRDFKDVFSFSVDEKGRRSGSGQGQVVATPAPPRKRLAKVRSVAYCEVNLTLNLHHVLQRHMCH